VNLALNIYDVEQDSRFGRKRVGRGKVFQSEAILL